MGDIVIGAHRWSRTGPGAWRQVDQLGLCPDYEIALLDEVVRLRGLIDALARAERALDTCDDDEGDYNAAFYALLAAASEEVDRG